MKRVREHKAQSIKTDCAMCLEAAHSALKGTYCIMFCLFILKFAENSHNIL